jgi:micrococcal nuclease
MLPLCKQKHKKMYEYKAKLDRIVDGDTIDLIIDMGFKITTKQRIRLADINTPETYGQKHDTEEYKAGMRAKNFVVKRLEENQNLVTINTSKLTGKYGRYIGVIWLDDSKTSLNDELVEKGFAKVAHY